MKEWSIPKVEELDISMTCSGGDASTTEQNGGFVYGSWHNATYNASEFEKCEGQGTVYRKTFSES